MWKDQDGMDEWMDGREKRRKCQFILLWISYRMHEDREIESKLWECHANNQIIHFILIYYTVKQKKEPCTNQPFSFSPPPPPPPNLQ